MRGGVKKEARDRIARLVILAMMSMGGEATLGQLVHATGLTERQLRNAILDPARKGHRYIAQVGPKLFRMRDAKDRPTYPWGENTFKTGGAL